jgi:hypothetical protein
MDNVHLANSIIFKAFCDETRLVDTVKYYAQIQEGREEMRTAVW